MKVEFYLGIGYAGAEHREIIDFPDEYTEQDIEEEFNDWMNNYLECAWNVLDG